MSTWIGIDIGTHSVKVAVVHSAYRKTQIQGLAEVKIADVASPEEAISTAMKQAMGERTKAPDGVSVALSGAKSTVRILDMPESVQKQVGSVLPFELESVLPYDVDEAVFDYRVLEGIPRSEGIVPVLVGVSKMADVEQAIALTRNAINAEPERVSLGPFPIANLIPFVPSLASDGTVLIVDLGTEMSDLLLLQKGAPVFARTLSLGTKGLPQSASKLARELRVSLASFRAVGGGRPDKLILVGGGSYVSGAEAFISRELEMPVERLSSVNSEFTDPDPALIETFPKFAKAIGLAVGLGGRPLALNLRKGPLSFERGFDWIKEKIPVLAGLATAVVVAFLFSTWADLYAQSNERTTLEAALSLVSKEVLGEETTSPQRANELLSKLSTSTDEDPLPHADAFDVMVKLAQTIPETMTHDIDELDVQKGHVTVHGIVGTTSDAQTLRTLLANERCFSDVKPPRTNQVVGGDRQKYVIEFDLKCPEDLKGADKRKEAPKEAPSAAPSATGGK